MMEPVCDVSALDPACGPYTDMFVIARRSGPFDYIPTGWPDFGH